MRSLILVGWSAAACWIGPAIGAGFQLCEQTQESVATACVGQALSSTAFDNPAALSSVEHQEIETGSRIVSLDHGFQPSLAPTQGGGNGGDAGAPVLMPTSHFTFRVDERVSVGMSLAAPYGLALKYDDGWVGRYYVEKISLQTINATVGVGVQAVDWLSVGAGASVQFAQARYRRKLNNALDGLDDGTFLMSLDDWGAGFNVGVMANLSPDVRLGISYRSRIAHDFEGDATLTGVGPTLSALGVAGTRADFPLKFA